MKYEEYSDYLDYGEHDYFHWMGYKKPICSISREAAKNLSVSINFGNSCSFLVEAGLSNVYFTLDENDNFVMKIACNPQSFPFTVSFKKEAHLSIFEGEELIGEFSSSVFHSMNNGEGNLNKRFLFAISSQLLWSGLFTYKFSSIPND